MKNPNIAPSKLKTMLTSIASKAMNSPQIMNKIVKNMNASLVFFGLFTRVMNYFLVKNIRIGSTVKF